MIIRTFEKCLQEVFWKEFFCKIRCKYSKDGDRGGDCECGKEGLVKLAH